MFWISDSNQKDLLSILEKYKDKEKMKLFIKEMIDLYIKKYKLGLIVVTNVKAAEYVKLAIGDKNRENCVFKYTYTDEEIKEKKVVPIIFSGYLANGMDQFSKTRLKKDIKEYYQICDKYWYIMWPIALKNTLKLYILTLECFFIKKYYKF